MECLGVYTGESARRGGVSNVLGFSRFRLGSEPTSNLIELVRQPATPEAAIDAARRCSSRRPAGRGMRDVRRAHPRPADPSLLQRRPAPPRRRLASADDIDTTLKLGLGYPEGPIGCSSVPGLDHHYDVTQALFSAYGDPAYAPARRALIAKQRAKAQVSGAEPCRSLERPLAGARARLQHAAARAARHTDACRSRRRSDQDRAPRARRRDALVRAEVRRRQRQLRAAQPRQAQRSRST
jgi:3-hydroxybutyryl-CoA dehydrogenase